MRFTDRMITGLVCLLCAALTSCERPQRLVHAPLTLVVAHERVRAPGLEMTAYFPNPKPQVQAVGSTHQPVDRRATDHAAHLRNPSRLRDDVPGVDVLSPAMGRNYGTYELVELIQQVGAGFDWRFPGQALRVGDLSKRRGGTIRDGSGRRVHSSHRNGLDADIMYLHRDCHGDGTFDAMDCPIGIEENLDVLQMFVDGGPYDDHSLVDVIYVGHAMRDRVCRYLGQDERRVRRYGELLDHMQVMSGHEAHFHVRIKCPETSVRCPAPRKHRPALCPRLRRR